jgi:hypothetical protein
MADFGWRRLMAESLIPRRRRKEEENKVFSLDAF